MTSKTAKNPSLEVPASLADVALIDASTAAGVGGMSVSWWHDEVRQGRAPLPVIREPRCTRWKLADVRDYWTRRAAQSNTQAAELVTAKAKKASDAAQAKRAARGAQ